MRRLLTFKMLQCTNGLMAHGGFAPSCCGELMAKPKTENIWNFWIKVTIVLPVVFETLKEEAIRKSAAMTWSSRVPLAVLPIRAAFRLPTPPMATWIVGWNGFLHWHGQFISELSASAQSTQSIDTSWRSKIWSWNTRTFLNEMEPLFFKRKLQHEQNNYD